LFLFSEKDRAFYILLTIWGPLFLYADSVGTQAVSKQSDPDHYTPAIRHAFAVSRQPSAERNHIGKYFKINK
jgi:hypothetical protein